MHNTNPTIHFMTKSGGLSVTKDDHDGCLLKMQLPLYKVAAQVPQACQPAGELVRICSGGLPVEDVRYTGGPLKYLLIVLQPGTSRQQLESLTPSFQAMSDAASSQDVSGVIVCLQPGDGPFDILSRFFAPWCGIPEDPVTGSAHAVLGPYWADRLGKSKLAARQCSPRGGDLQLTVDTAAGTVEVAGEAVIVVQGSLLLPERLG